MKKTVASYIADLDKWRELVVTLIDIIHTTELVETVKWNMPVYTINKKNVVAVGAFKNHVALWFTQGVFLEDAYGKLRNAQEKRTKAMRQWRFTKMEDIDPPVIKAYLEEAIQNQKDGKEILPTRSKQRKPLLIPDLLQEVLDNNPRVKASFEALKLTQKRNHCNFINQAKQLTTKKRRLERIIPLILAGKGIYE